MEIFVFLVLCVVDVFVCDGVEKIFVDVLFVCVDVFVGLVLCVLDVLCLFGVCVGEDVLFESFFVCLVLCVLVIFFGVCDVECVLLLSLLFWCL
jgi:hypothetical protein